VGLIRGSIAYALILEIHHKNEEEEMQVHLMQTTVLIMVIITTIILGGLMPYYIKLNLNQVKSSKEEAEAEPKKSKSKLIHCLTNVDNNYLKPFFIYQYKERKE
jgi:sodium/hydrogen exchanger-like protein 6/7/sodium/hydrogen exchanger 8